MTVGIDLFPSRPRVVFSSNPLIEVVCQLRFPAILKIDNELPVEFQESIRASFPGFQRQVAIGAPELPEPLAQLLGGMLPQNNSSFLTKDSDYKVILNSSSISLTTNSYVDWKIFRDLMTVATESFYNIYKPAYFDRVGLRYRNVVKRSKLGIADCEWRHLLNPVIAGELTEEGWSNETFEVQKALRASLGSSGYKLFFQHGFGREGEEEEICYLLDFDYYTQDRLETENVVGTIERLHDYSGSAFQWCISEKLHLALGPGR